MELDSLDFCSSRQSVPGSCFPVPPHKVGKGNPRASKMKIKLQNSQLYLKKKVLVDCLSFHLIDEPIIEKFIK